MALSNQSAFSYSYTMYERLYLENHTAGHRKFYEMTHTGSGWTARWGRIGISGQTMYYHSSLWHDKLDEKLKKGYEIQEAEPIHVGTPPPVVKPKKPDPEILTDPEVMEKLDRLVLFLNDRGKDDWCSRAENIKLEYIETGILTKADMKQLNEFWIKSGGKKW